MKKMKKNCEQTLELLKSGYLDNELESSEREEINLHLAECPACRSANENLAAIESALRNAPRVNPPENLWPRIQAEIRQMPESITKINIYSHANVMQKNLAKAQDPQRKEFTSSGVPFFSSLAGLARKRNAFVLAAAAALVLMAVGVHLTVDRQNDDATAPSLTAILGNDEMREPNLNFGSAIENYFL